MVENIREAAKTIVLASILAHIGLDDIEDTISLYILQSLHVAAGPTNFNLICSLALPQAEMDAPIA
jgi:hypothetical protein